MIKKWFIVMGYFWGMICSLTFVITICDYYSLISNNIVSIIKFITPIVAIFISSYKLGTYSNQKGYLEGIKNGIICVGEFLLLIFILDKITIKSLLYYLILFIISILGSMLGINRKK